jgi:hypothetical protein
MQPSSIVAIALITMPTALPLSMEPSPTVAIASIKIGYGAATIDAAFIDRGYGVTKKSM